MKNHVFLSYSHKDIYRARRLRDALLYYDLPVWPPEQIMTPGTPSWQAEARDRVRDACCVVLVLSRDTRLSNWVTIAVEEAEAHSIPVLPVLMDGDADNLLLVELEGEAWFDLRWSRNYLAEFTEMVALIRQYMGAPIPVTITPDA